MHDVKITALRQTVYDDLTAQYENPVPEPCTLAVGSEWVSEGGRMPEGFCPSAWETLGPFAERLARGEGNFFDGWMRNPHSALLSCNDGFRPMSFLLERVDDETNV